MDWTILFPIAIGLVFLIVAVVILVSIIRAIATWHHNNQQPVLQESVRLVAKRFATSGSSSNSGGQVITRYYVTFEFLSGQRQEFSVRGRQYGMLAEGDKGVLTYQGTRYLGFERQLN